MSVSGDTAAPGGWATRRATKRLGGMAEALSIAADLGFAVPLPSAVQIALVGVESTLEEFIIVMEIHQTLSSSVSGNKSDELIRILRELTTVQRNIANLQVELQGRKDDKNVAYLTHVSEMEKKCESLSKITSILKDVIQNKDRIIARLQQPYSLDCIPVEAEYQKQFSELLLKAASDYSALTASVADFQWSQNFREPPTVWGEMLRPIPAALASCTRFFEAMSAMRESFTTLQQLRIGQSSLPMTPCDSSGEDSKFVTPPQCREGAINSDDSIVDSWRQQTVDICSEEADGITQRRLSWPPSLKKSM